MTREERKLTIEYLEGIMDNYVEGYGYERHPLPEYYAIESAIKALEQEPILDKIRAEIMQIAIEERKHDRTWATGLRYAVRIIDKYRESEG